QAPCQGDLLGRLEERDDHRVLARCNLRRRGVGDHRCGQRDQERTEGHCEAYEPRLEAAAACSGGWYRIRTGTRTSFVRAGTWASDGVDDFPPFPVPRKRFVVG